MPSPKSGVNGWNCWPSCAGLEALEQPSRVTLITASKYVSRGLADGLQDWRENDWQWENHGAMVPIKNRDLWQRLDRALAFHRLECRAWRVDSAEPAVRSGSPESEVSTATEIERNNPAAEFQADRSLAGRNQTASRTSRQT